MNRTDAIRKIVAAHPGAAFVFANGLVSRQAVGALGLDGPYLYLLHGMGEALSVSLGLASALDREVVAVDGDGNAAMGLAARPLLRRFPNLRYYILDNQQYATTGGQEVPDFSDLDTDLVRRVAIEEDAQRQGNPPPPEQILASFQRHLSA